MPRFAIILLLFVWFSLPAAAQSPGVELQGGAGYVRDSGEGPSVRTASAGAVLWLTQNVGIGGRFIQGIGNDHFDPAIQAGDRIFFGPGGLRMWTATAQGRWLVHGLEWNLGVGWGGHSYEYQETLTGIRRGDGTIDPITPTPIPQRYGTGFIASEVLVGRRLVGRLHVKGGFTYGLAGDVHPFQPLVVLTVKSR